MVLVDTEMVNFTHKRTYSISESTAVESEITTSENILPKPTNITPALSFSSMSTSKIQDIIDNVHFIVDQLDGSFPFTVFKWDNGMGVIDEIPECTRHTNGAFVFLSNNIHSTPFINLGSWICLKHDLEISPLESGNPILSNGGYKITPIQYYNIFKCSYCYYKRRGSSAKQATEGMPFQSTQHSSMIKNGLGIDGKKGVKRDKMTDKVEICKFNFSIYWDYYGYFINLKNNSGNSIIMDTLNTMTRPIYASLQGCWLRKKKKQCIVYLNPLQQVSWKELFVQKIWQIHQFHEGCLPTLKEK